MLTLIIVSERMDWTRQNFQPLWAQSAFGSMNISDGNQTIPVEPDTKTIVVTAVSSKLMVFTGFNPSDSTLQFQLSDGTFELVHVSDIDSLGIVTGTQSRHYAKSAGNMLGIFGFSIGLLTIIQGNDPLSSIFIGTICAGIDGLAGAAIGGVYGAFKKDITYYNFRSGWRITS